MKTETREAFFVSAQYAERPNPTSNEDIIKSVPMSASNKRRFDIVSEGDAKPFEFVQEVKFGEKFPATNGDIYTEEWAQSYAKKANAALLPGSKDGHTALSAYKQRVNNHIYVTAAKVDGNSLFIRHYVSNELDSKDYAKLVKEIKAGLISTSVLGLFKFESITDKTGKSIIGWKAVESVGAERNDLVEWDQTGMASKIVATSQKADHTNIVGEEGERVMTYKELIDGLKAAMADAGTSPAKVIADLGLDVEILSASQKQDLSVYEALKTKAGGDVGAKLDSALAAEKIAFTSLKDKAIADAFKDNPEIVEFATDAFAIREGSQKEINAEIDRIKALPSVVKMAAQSADGRNGSVVSGQETAGSSGVTVINVGGRK